ncbi:MAG TPA: penicillin-binding protein 2 [Candidatus Saccharimonadales bacterium]|nr:penicillin-binding protein 2 [Candidatus Saccharimonadales bacterium]
MRPSSAPAQKASHTRIRIWYGLLLLVMGLVVIKLFYLQIIRHDYYRRAALQGQLKEYEIPAERGIIAAYNGNDVLPIVLNETKYTLFADPKFIKDTRTAAAQIQHIIGGNGSDYEKAMKQDTRYAVLAKKLTKDQKEQIDKLNLKGIGTRDTMYRTYPQGDLAAQVLGFVNDDGDGKYGVEQSLDGDLKGSPGELKAITDAQGVPLVTNKDNIITQPQPGKRILLTIDISMQKQLQDILKAGLDAAKSGSGSALIMDPYTGAVKAMANYPSYNPAEFFKVDDGSVFNNAAVSSPLEVGSVMKTLTAAAALDQGVVTTNSTYYDPSKFVVDGYTIKNIEEDGGPGTRSVADILQLSLNTGATWLLMQMGGGEINAKARNAWHDYMVNHYMFGKPTGIEQGYEADGSIPDPNNGYGLNLQYANTAFGQGMSATPIQMGAALSAALNGGTYYKPHVVDTLTDSKDNETKTGPTVVSKNVVKPEVSKTLQSLMEYVVSKNHALYGLPQLPAGYSIGGKTGTAEITKPGGGYYDDRFNGTFVGFVGGDKPQYVIIVRVNEPHVSGYAGAGAAAPIFSHLTTMLINNFGITPKGQ